jgi:acetyl-CoA carboxylase biotin carboxylase subunit
MKKALEEFKVAGVETSIPFHRSIVQHADYRRAKVNTRWLEESLMRECEEHEKD